MKKTKMCLSVLMAALLMAAMPAAAFADETGSVYKDGFYTSTVRAEVSDDMVYDLPVTIKISDGKIADVAYTKDIHEVNVASGSDVNYLIWAMEGHNVTDEIYQHYKEKYERHGDPVLPQNGEGMRKQIIEKNGIEGVDTVTGATVSSRAIKDAVELSLKNAEEGKKDDPEPVLPKPDDTQDVIPEDSAYMVKDVEATGFDVSSDMWVLYVKDGKIKADMGIKKAKRSFPYLFQGTEAEALAAGETGWLEPLEYDYKVGEKEKSGTFYTGVPVRSLDKKLMYVMHAQSSGQWFYRFIRIAKDDLIKVPYGDYKPAEFSFTGGTGKVNITCDVIHVTPEGVTADLKFSSTKYTKVSIGGKEYLPSQKKADCTVFTVPLMLNADTKVSGTTNAMSQEHTIEYTCSLKFDANDLKPAKKEKEKNKMTVKAVKKTLKAKALKKKAASFKAVTVKKAAGKVTYSVKASGKAKKFLKFNKKNAKITVKKGTKKGTYKMKVTVKDPGSSAVSGATKKVTVTVKVK